MPEYDCKLIWQRSWLRPRVDLSTKFQANPSVEGFLAICEI